MNDIERERLRALRASILQSYNQSWNNNPDGTPADGYPHCEKCRNKRRIMEMQTIRGNDYEFSQECDCMKQIRALRNIRQSGLEIRLNDCNFENFVRRAEHQKQMYNLAQEFLHSNAKNWFAVLGQSGAGKTHICTALCGELLKRGQSVKLLRWAVELKRIKMLGGGSDEYCCEIDKIFENDVIYIDDLFKRGGGYAPNDADVRLAFEIVDTAAALEKTLILSCEDTLRSLIDIDEATAGRIRQQCGKYLLQIPRDQTKNYRLTNENIKGEKHEKF